ncbi:MAG TPA: retropepsin-like aspartic protease [Candidatus Methylacidiphilales bacterium]
MRILALLLLLGRALVPGAAASVADLLASEGFSSADVYRPEGGNAAFVKVEINGHPLVLCIDTGSPMTVLSRSAAQRANVPTHRLFGPVSGINGVADPKAAIASLRSFRMNGRELATEPVLVSDAPFPGKTAGLAFDGLLGWRTMKKNRMVFGYAPALLFFRADGRAARGLDEACRAEQFLPVRLRSFRDAHYLTVSFDGSPARMLLDSGAAFTMLSGGFAKLNLGSPVGESSGLGIDGNPVLQRKVKPKTMEIGGHLFPAVPVASADARLFEKRPITPANPRAAQIDGLLGYDVVGQFYSLLDFGNDRLYLHPRPEAGLPVATGSASLTR